MNSPASFSFYATVRSGSSARELAANAVLKSIRSKYTNTRGCPNIFKQKPDAGFLFSKAAPGKITATTFFRSLRSGRSGWPMLHKPLCQSSTRRPSKARPCGRALSPGKRKSGRVLGRRAASGHSALLPAVHLTIASTKLSLCSKLLQAPLAFQSRSGAHFVLASFWQVWHRGREEVRRAEGPYPLSLAIASLHASGASAKALLYQFSFCEQFPEMILPPPEFPADRDRIVWAYDRRGENSCDILQCGHCKTQCFLSQPGSACPTSQRIRGSCVVTVFFLCCADRMLSTG